MKMPRRKETLSVELKIKLAIMFFLAVVLVINIFWKAFSNKESSGMVETEMETLPEEELIQNLAEFAVPVLEENAELLNRQLEKFAEGTGKEISSAEIFYVLVNESDAEKVDFYVKVFPANEIVKLTFDYNDGSVDAESCLYTEEEIKNEIWNGEAPAIRDVQ